MVMHRRPAFHNMNTVVGAEIMEEVGMNPDVQVTDEVFRCGASIIFDQAENRLYAIVAVVIATLGS
jgi:ornithine carbamoyltransferase